MTKILLALALVSLPITTARAGEVKVEEAKKEGKKMKSTVKKDGKKMAKDAKSEAKKAWAKTKSLFN